MKSAAEIPDFKSEDEIADWYQTHSTVLIQDQLETLPARVGGKLRTRLASRRGNANPQNPSPHPLCPVYLESHAIAWEGGSRTAPYDTQYRPRPRNSSRPLSRKTCPSTDGLPDFVADVVGVGIQALKFRRVCVQNL